ncbi:unnamed protein product [Mytilus coruscus]|uniref:PHD-type domain-containing protein n=1 Tax=Mytilus coruscus TaxID=42192 RepID=A0A6J8CS11_MYTCO|nr:unnamed protein product [Mytilus coruscus]
MDRSMETRTYKRALSTGNLLQVKQTTKSNRNYAINRDKALESKNAKFNYQHLTFEMKAGKNFVVEFSTAAYELAKSRILTLLQSTNISTNYTVLEQHGVEQSNLKIDSCYKVYNRKNNNQPENMLKFTINLFHTTNKMTVNGNRVDIFINEIFDSLCSEIKIPTHKFKGLLFNSHTSGWEKQSAFSVIATTRVKSNVESRGKTTSIPAIMDITDTSSTQHQTENKNNQVICPKCETLVENEGIACDICDNWYHYMCSNIKEGDLKLYEGSDFHCQQCNTDQQNEEENEDYTVPKQIFYELGNQQAQIGTTIINSSNIPKVIDQSKKLQATVVPDTTPMTGAPKQRTLDPTNRTKGKQDHKRQSKSKAYDSEQHINTIQKTRILDLENEVKQLRNVLQTFKDYGRSEVNAQSRDGDFNLPP